MNQLCRELVSKVVLARAALSAAKSSPMLLASATSGVRSCSSSSVLLQQPLVCGSKSSLLSQASKHWPIVAASVRTNVTTTNLSAGASQPQSSRDFEEEQGSRRRYGAQGAGRSSGSGAGGYAAGGSGSGGAGRGGVGKRFVPKSSFNEADYEGAEQFEADGHQVSYSADKSSGFAEYNLHPELLSRLTKCNYTKPFLIQAETLVHSLSGKDLVGRAFTGSGKTLAFAIPIVNKILNMKTKSRYPKCLILSPTRELCLQLTKAVEEIAPQLKCVSVYGGAMMSSQISALSGHVDVVCATPGRLKDLLGRKNFVPDDIEIVCLDEADELLRPGFLEDITEVIELASQNKQMLMFSATMPKTVMSVVNKYMKNPINVDLTVGQKHKMPENIEHFLLKLPYFTAIKSVPELINKFDSKRTIVFCNTKRASVELASDLKNMGLKAADIHSDISQNSRQRILSNFRSGRISILVATDVAARGLDVPEVDLVVNIGTPTNGLDYYIHRSGRTGRAGRPGKSVLIDVEKINNPTVNEISRLIRFKMIAANEIKDAVNAMTPQTRRKYDDNAADDNVERLPRSRFQSNSRSYSGGIDGEDNESGYTRRRAESTFEPSAYPKKTSSYQRDGETYFNKYTRRVDPDRESANNRSSTKGRSNQGHTDDF